LSEEDALVEQARRGDKEAYRRLVETYQDRLFGLVLSLVPRRTQAEDLTQEIFVKAYFALPSFKGQSAFYTWLYRIASNHCLDHLRRHPSEPMSLDAPLDEEEGTTFGQTLEAPRSERPDIRLDAPSEASALLGRLEPDQRLILTLRELEGYTYEELADILKCPINTVKSRLNRAREALKAAYIDLFGNIPDNKIVSESGGKR
jgi:RNA polymerase sigma-70 factor (ECF subfamily)